MKLRFILCTLILFGLSNQSLAGSEHTMTASAKKKSSETGERSVDYSINGQRAMVKIKLEKNNQHDGLLTDYLFEKLQPAILNNQYVTGIQFSAGEDQLEVRRFGLYDLHNRTSHAYVTLSLPTKVSLLFEVKETYRVCKPEKSDCNISNLQSEVQVVGPVAVYGSYATFFDVDSFLKDKQSLSWSIRKGYVGEDLYFEGEFKIESQKFEEGLMKFAKAFGVDLVGGASDTVQPMAGAAQSLLTRRHLLLGASRTLRLMNEEVLGL